MKKKLIVLSTLICVLFAFFSCQKKMLTDEDVSAEVSNDRFLKTRGANDMVVESLMGPITSNEITAFKNYIQNYAAPSNNDQNVWVFGNPGKAIEASGLMYDATGNLDILNRMIYYCDKALAGRNDLASSANGGQRTVWSGTIAPVWPSTASGVSPAGAGVESGQVIAHMALCARLILEHSAIWNTTVSTGDPYSFGTTYKQRALKYITEGDYVMDNWIIPRFVRTSDKKIYFPGAPNTYKPNDPAPWNQMFMVTNGLIRLLQCHLILNDAASRVSNYDDIVQANVDWFKANLTTQTAANGNTCWNWKYALGGSTEDTNHAAYDAEGWWIAYDSGRYGLTLNDIKYMANTYFDIVLATVTNGIYAGKVDGTTGSGNSGGDGYVRPEYYYLADIRKDRYFKEANINIDNNLIAGSPGSTARILWLKNRRQQAGDGYVSLYQNCSYGGWKANFEIGNFLMADIASHEGVNDDASSLKVPPGLKVILYTNNSYGGTSLNFTGDDSCLSDNGNNDMTSSLKVQLAP